MSVRPVVFALYGDNGRCHDIVIPYDKGDYDGISPCSCQRVFVLMADHADDDGITWPGIERMARQLRLAKIDVRRCIEVLEHNALVTLIERGGGRGKRSRYRINMPASEVQEQDQKGEGKGEGKQEGSRPSQPGQTWPTREPIGSPPTPSSRGQARKAPQRSSLPPRLPIDTGYDERIAASRAEDPEVQRARGNELFAALMRVCGIERPTDPERTALAQAAAHLSDVHATAEDVAERAAAFRRTWPRMTLTPRGLAKHWSTFAPTAATRPMDDEEQTRLRLNPWLADPSLEVNEPPGSGVSTPVRAPVSPPHGSHDARLPREAP